MDNLDNFLLDNSLLQTVLQRLSPQKTFYLQYLNINIGILGAGRGALEGSGPNFN